MTRQWITRSTSHNTIASASRRIVCLALISAPSSRFFFSRRPRSPSRSLPRPPAPRRRSFLFPIADSRYPIARLVFLLLPPPSPPLPRPPPGPLALSWPRFPPLRRVPFLSLFLPAPRRRRMATVFVADGATELIDDTAVRGPSRGLFGSRLSLVSAQENARNRAAANKRPG